MRIANTLTVKYEVSAMHRAISVSLILLVGGCTDPAVDEVTWACSSHDECGSGWLCHSVAENVSPTCNQAWSNVNGVDDDTLRLGVSAAFSGVAEDLGKGMRAGIKACFKEVNDSGGVHGRRLELVELDDRYEPAQAQSNVEALTDGSNRQVFALIGNVGTPTAKVTIPVLERNDTILFGPFTGAKLVRDAKQHVFSFRASYYDETRAMVQYLKDDFEATSLDKLGPHIAVFAQGQAGQASDYPDHIDHQENPTPIDAYGLDGFNGVATALGWDLAKAMACTRENECLVHWTYPRNGCMNKALDVKGECSRSAPTQYLASSRDKAVAWLEALSRDADEAVNAAIIMVPTAHPAANFIKLVRDEIAANEDIKVNLTFLSVSFVGADALAEALREAGKGADTAGLCEGVIVTQVVPKPDSSLTGVTRYRNQLEALKDADITTPGFVSLEGNLAANLLVEALRKHGRDLNTRSFMATLSDLPAIDLGLRHPVHFDGSNQAHNTAGTLNVWGTSLQGDCRTYGEVGNIDPAQGE